MSSFFFCNDTADTEFYTLSLHDALPIFTPKCFLNAREKTEAELNPASKAAEVMESLGTVRSKFAARSSRIRTTISFTVSSVIDRKSTRLNSSHSQISYAVFCLKKKNTTQ